MIIKDLKNSITLTSGPPKTKLIIIKLQQS